MAHFDEKSGYIRCKTEWGQWWQTNEEVFIEINVPQGTLAKDIKCAFAPKHIKIAVKGETVLEVVSHYRLCSLPVQCLFIQMYFKKTKTRKTSFNII